MMALKKIIFLLAFFLQQLAPDNKIYINCTNGVSYLHVINNPNEEGLSCNLTQHSFRLPTLNASSIPNFPNFRLGAWKGSACDTLQNISTKELGIDKILIYPNPAYDLLNISILDNFVTLQVECFDIQGRKIYHSNFQNATQINTAAWQRGLFAVVIRDEFGRLMKTEKIILE